LRIRLGVLHLANAGAQVTFTAETNSPVVDPAAWYGQHLNTSNSVVDFGDARTDGSVWLRRIGNVWLLKTWPRSRNFTLELNAARFAPPAKVQCIGGTASEIAPVPSGTRWRLPLNGASEYRWTNAPPRLSVFRTNAAVIVSWPAPADGFLLEAASDLAPPATWIPVTNPILSVSGQLSVVLRSIGPRQFHRLKLPQ
jgi:hypothetical protein